MSSGLKYKYSDFSIWFTAVTACMLCCFYVWQNNPPVNFIGGDARYYYYYLQSTFVNSWLINFDWMDPANGVVITHHPVGLSLLWLPFFLVAYVIANLFGYPLDGMSAPFQASISIAAIFYTVVGLIFLKKLFSINHISDKVSALIIVLVFFGTTLFHYTLNESGMSHSYSFALLAAFMYYSCAFVRNQQQKNLLLAAVMFGLIMLVRPNNGLIIFSFLFWFKSGSELAAFLKNLVRSKTFYFAVLIIVAIVAIQPLTWLWKENTLFVNRYATYGFYWSHPQLLEMLFGFEAGFFIYTPLCLLFLSGLISIYKNNKFLFYSSALFILLLFYIFSSYSAYTYYDGLGIRVLIDYYSLFALIGAKLFMQLGQYKLLFNLAGTASVFLVVVNLIYCYQGENNILARSGMNFNKWKYIFLRTNQRYENVLGGSSDLAPYSKVQPDVALNKELPLTTAFNFSGNEYGPALLFDSIGFFSKRIRLKLGIARTETSANSSKDVLVCAMLENNNEPDHKRYLQFKLNEIPSEGCCETITYDYSANMEAEFKPSDKLTVYLWNIKKQAFLLNKFSVQVYNY